MSFPQKCKYHDNRCHGQPGPHHKLVKLIQFLGRKNPHRQKEIDLCRLYLVKAPCLCRDRLSDHQPSAGFDGFHRRSRSILNSSVSLEKSAYPRKLLLDPPNVIGSPEGNTIVELYEVISLFTNFRDGSEGRGWLCDFSIAYIR